MMQTDHTNAFSECLTILRSSPFFWDVWLLLIDSVRDLEQVSLNNILSSFEVKILMNRFLFCPTLYQL